MKNETKLKIYLLSQTSMDTQWTSLLGDKFLRALPFDWTFTSIMEEAHVIVWDGLMNAKGAYYLERARQLLASGGPVLLLQRSAQTLFREHPFVREADLSGARFVELPSGNVLPEDLLAGIEACYKKLNNV